MKRSIDVIATLLLAVVATSPAVAGCVAAPDPEVGLGLGALVLIGAGYRVLRRKIGN